MPRIYYNQDDYHGQYLLYIIHATAYCVGVVWLWYWAIASADLITFSWTILLAYHNYWRAPLTDGTQFRTYNRLRNRFGKDWDLAALPEEFDLESKMATLEIKRKHIIPNASFALIASGAATGLLWVISRIFISKMPLIMIAGWLMTVILLNIIIRLRLDRATTRYDKLKRKQVNAIDTPVQNEYQAIDAGQDFVLGDDGELIERRKEDLSKS